MGVTLEQARGLFVAAVILAGIPFLVGLAVRIIGGPASRVADSSPIEVLALALGGDPVALLAIGSVILGYVAATVAYAHLQS